MKTTKQRQFQQQYTTTNGDDMYCRACESKCWQERIKLDGKTACE